MASLLDLPVAAGSDVERVAGDTMSFLSAWTTLIEPVGWDVLTAPTPSRQRTVRNLTVNVFHPFELLPVAWRDGRFEWDPDKDDEREALLESAAELHGYASAIAHGWTAFLLEIDAELGTRDPSVGSPRGEITFSNLLEQQRWHAAFHYRQISDFLSAHGSSGQPLDLTSFAGLDLPAAVY